MAVSQLGTGEARICLLPELSLLFGQDSTIACCRSPTSSGCRLQRRRSARIEVLPADSPPERTARARRAGQRIPGTHAPRASRSPRSGGGSLPRSQILRSLANPRERHFTGFRTGSVDGVLGRCRIRVAHLWCRHTFAGSQPVRIPVGRRFAVPRVPERNYNVLRKAISAARSSSDKASPN